MLFAEEGCTQACAAAELRYRRGGVQSGTLQSHSVSPSESPSFGLGALSSAFLDTLGRSNHTPAEGRGRLGHDGGRRADRMDPEFWFGKSVFLTGHTGFKGSWLSLWLQCLGAEVVGYGLEPPTKPALYELARVGEGMTSISGDVRDRSHLQSVIAQQQPEIVLHLAAQPIVRESYRNPVDTFSTNVMGTVHLLEAVRHVEGIRAVVCITSDKCYDNKEWLWGYREYEPMGGRDPYSSSKGCAELVAKAYRTSFLEGDRNPRGSVAVATARAGNVIGGGDWASDRLVPDILRSLAAGERLLVRNPQAVRPWQHVLDPLNGYLVLAERLYLDGETYSGGWNFGPPVSNSRSVQWVVEHLLSLFGAPGLWQQDERSQPYEDIQLSLDSSKARQRLKWNAHLGLETALEWVAAWMRALQSGSDMRDMSEAQIREFTNVMQAATQAHTEMARFVTSQTPAGLEQAQLFELTPDATMVRRVDGTIVYWNHHAEAVYGWSKDEAIGRVSHALLRTEFPGSLEAMENQLLTNGSWEGDLVHTTREGKRLNVRSYWAVQSGQALSNAAVVEVNRI